MLVIKQFFTPIPAFLHRGGRGFGNRLRRGVCAGGLVGALPRTYGLARGLCRAYAIAPACLDGSNAAAIIPERNR